MWKMGQYMVGHPNQKVGTLTNAGNPVSALQSLPLQFWWKKSFNIKIVDLNSWTCFTKFTFSRKKLNFVKSTFTSLVTIWAIEEKDDSQLPYNASWVDQSIAEVCSQWRHPLPVAVSFASQDKVSSERGMNALLQLW